MVTIKQKVRKMPKIQDKDTRYFIEIDLKTLKVVGNGHDHKQNLDQGRQTNPKLHRLFLTKGQYNKLVERCELLC